MGIFSKLFGRKKSKAVKPRIVNPRDWKRKLPPPPPKSPGCIEPSKPWPRSQHIDDK